MYCLLAAVKKTIQLVTQINYLYQIKQNILKFHLFFSIYSPSGAALHKIEEIKDYLLSAGTCKCGLPCPLQPEYLFEFNPQVSSSFHIYSIEFVFPLSLLLVLRM